MGKKKYTEKQNAIFNKKFLVQNFEQPEDADKKEKVHLTSYMLKHKSWIKLNSLSKILYIYMKEWARNNERWTETDTFEYSASMLEKLGVMSSRQSQRCFKELENAGFIKRINSNLVHTTETAVWMFTDNWYTGRKS